MGQGGRMHKKTPTKRPGFRIIAEGACLDVEREQIGTRTTHGDDVRITLNIQHDQNVITDTIVSERCVKVERVVD